MQKSGLKSVAFAQTICNNCDSSIATHACQECSEKDCYLCDSCAALHLKVKTFRGHNLSKFSGFKSNK